MTDKVCQSADDGTAAFLTATGCYRADFHIFVSTVVAVVIALDCIFVAIKSCSFNNHLRMVRFVIDNITRRIVRKQRRHFSGLLQGFVSVTEIHETWQGEAICKNEAKKRRNQEALSEIYALDFVAIKAAIVC